MRRIAAAALLVLLAASTADARQHFPARGHRILPASSAPLDAFTQPSGAYSFRKLKSPYAGPAVRLRRAGDNAETDINFLGCTGFTGCPWDEAAAIAHCAATSCFVKTRYDQSGNGRDQTQATAANQPALVFNCLNTSLPCIEMTSATQSLSSGSLTPATGVMSLSIVANRVTVAVGQCLFLSGDGGSGNRIVSSSSNANQWNLISPGGGGISPVAGVTSNAWHAAQAVVNGAASNFKIDSTDNTGTATGAVTAGGILTSGVAGLTCRGAEVIVWDNYALTAGEATALAANQKSFWGTP